MAWINLGVAAVTVIGGAVSAKQQKKGAKGAANAALQGSRDEIAERQRQYDLTRSDQKPWLDAGSGALTQMQALNSGDFSSFRASPDYQFTLQQGQQALDRGAAARGGLYSGGHTADTINYGQGAAAQQYGNYYGRLQSMAGQGQSTASGLGALGANMGNQNANSMRDATSARMSSYGARADANSQFAGLVGNQFGRAWGAYTGGRG